MRRDRTPIREEAPPPFHYVDVHHVEHSKAQHDEDDRQEALQEATLKAKANLSKFLSETIATDEGLDALPADVVGDLPRRALHEVRRRRHQGPDSPGDQAAGGGDGRKAQ